MSAIPTPELFRSYPELRERLPWVSLARATPVDRLLRLESYLQSDSIWVKRDDQTSSLCGGDKPRKLEFLFGDMLRRGSRRLLAFGAVGSGYGLALTAFAHQFRLKPILALVRPAQAGDVQRTLEIEHDLGAELHRLDGGPGALVRLLRRVLAGRSNPDEPRLPYVVRPGRATLFGTLGYVNAAYELKRQINTGILPEPARIYVPVRTGSLAAGLLLGCRLAHIRSRIVGVTSGKRPRPGVVPLALRAAHLLQRKTRRFPRVTIRADQLELRHEYAGRRGEAAPAVHQMTGLLRDLESLVLDPGYGGRALAALAQDAGAGRATGPALFWNAPQSHILKRTTHLSLEALPREFREFFVAR